MTKNTLKIALSAIALGLMASTASFAADAPIYGSQLMTNQERIEHRNKMQAAKTAEESSRQSEWSHRVDYRDGMLSPKPESEINSVATAAPPHQRKITEMTEITVTR